jgi:hypothetical protein
MYGRGNEEMKKNSYLFSVGVAGKAPGLARVQEGRILGEFHVQRDDGPSDGLLVVPGDVQLGRRSNDVEAPVSDGEAMRSRQQRANDDDDPIREASPLKNWQRVSGGSHDDDPKVLMNVQR